MKYGKWEYNLHDNSHMKWYFRKKIPSLSPRLLWASIFIKSPLSSVRKPKQNKTVFVKNKAKLGVSWQIPSDCL